MSSPSAVTQARTAVAGAAGRASPLAAMAHEGVLGALLLAEVIVFSVIGHNFLTLANAFEIVPELTAAVRAIKARG